MLRLTIFLTFILVAVEGRTAIKDDFQDAQMSMMTVIQRALLEENSIETVVATGVTVAPDRQDEILGSAIAVTPGSVGQIVTSAVQSGVNAQIIANQCNRALTTQQVATLVGSAISAGTNPDPIIATCLGAVPSDRAAEVVAAAIANVDGLLLDRVLLSSLDVMDQPGVDARQVVADGMVQSGMTIGTELISEPLALSMLDTLELESTAGEVQAPSCFDGLGAGQCTVTTDEDAVLVGENAISEN